MYTHTCTHTHTYTHTHTHTHTQVIGVALIALGIYLLASQNDLRFITGNEYASGGTLILISGIVTFIIAFIGIVGASGMWPIVLSIVSLPPLQMYSRYIPLTTLCWHVQQRDRVVALLSVSLCVVCMQHLNKTG